MHYYNYSHLNSGKDSVSHNYVSSGIFSSQKERDDSVIRLLQWWSSPEKLLPPCSSCPAARHSWPSHTPRLCHAAVWGLNKLSGLRINHFFPIWEGLFETQVISEANLISLLVYGFTLCPIVAVSECQVIWQALHMFYLASIKGWDSPAIISIISNSNNAWGVIPRWGVATHTGWPMRHLHNTNNK